MFENFSLSKFRDKKLFFYCYFVKLQRVEPKMEDFLSEPTLHKFFTVEISFFWSSSQYSELLLPLSPKLNPFLASMASNRMSPF